MAGEDRRIESGADACPFLQRPEDAVRQAARLDTPLLTTVHGHDITKRDNGGAEIRLGKDFFSRVGRVIAVSRFMAGQALQRGGPEHKLVQHYIGIDL